MSAKNLMLLAGGYFALKHFAGIDLLEGILSTPSSQPTTTNPTGSGTHAVVPSGTMPTNPNPTQVTVTANATMTNTANSGGNTHPVTGRGQGSASNVTGLSNATGMSLAAMMAEWGNRISSTYGNGPFNFHEWQTLFRDQGLRLLPPPEDVSLGDGMQPMYKDQYISAILMYAQATGTTNGTGRGMGSLLPTQSNWQPSYGQGNGLGNIVGDVDGIAGLAGQMYTEYGAGWGLGGYNVRPLNQGLTLANPVESMPMTWRGN